MKAIASTRFQMTENEFAITSMLEYQVMLAVDNDYTQNQMYNFMDALRWHSSAIIIAQGGKNSNMKLRRHMKFKWDRERLLENPRATRVKDSTIIELEGWKSKYIPLPNINNKNKTGKSGEITKR